MVHLILPLIVASVGASPNLLENSSFELQGMAAWQIAVPPGAAASADSAVMHSGKASCRLSIPKAAPISWYHAFRSVTPLKRGATYTISAPNAPRRCGPFS
jgi:hypothetical protein